ncbi:hypothetical protein [Neobacillus sp. CF12]|nr:hypothetical protein [Neobacillus sp. CF12]MDM5328652.1 hypothetical protein [Neobacillus sp. CF12]
MMFRNQYCKITDREKRSDKQQMPCNKGAFSFTGYNGTERKLRARID